MRKVARFWRSTTPWNDIGYYHSQSTGSCVPYLKTHSILQSHRAIVSSERSFDTGLRNGLWHYCFRNGSIASHRGVRDAPGMSAMPLIATQSVRRNEASQCADFGL